MGTKSLLCVMLLTLLALFTTPLFAQERAASSMSVERVRSPNVSINDLREVSKNTFDLLDVNDSNSITLDEIDILEELIAGEEELPPDELASLRHRSNVISWTFMQVEEEIDHFEVADQNNDGTLDADEFEAREASLRTHILQLNLDSYDKDKSGSVELNEFSAHLDNIEEIDADGDGNISREEFRGVSDQRVRVDLRVNQYQREALKRPVEVEVKENTDRKTR